MKKKNICFAHSVSVVGGAEKMTLAIMKSLDKNRFQPFLLSPNDGDFSKEALHIGGSNLFDYFFQPEKLKPIQTLLSFIRQFNLLKKNEISVIHTGDLLATRSLMNSSSKSKLPLIVHVHFPFEEEFIAWTFKGKAKPAGFIYCSQELYDNVADKIRSCCPESKHWVVHNGVDTSRFNSQPKKREQVIEIGIVANLQERKGHNDFLQMAKIIKDKGYNVHFSVIGGDILEAPREPFLKELARDLELDEIVTFTGQVNNIDERLHGLDIFVCASHEEAFPVSILEAMACQKPIVSTGVNGIPEAIKHEKHGLLVEPHSPDKLAEMVEKLINDELLSQELARNAYQRVNAEFSEQEYVKKVMAIYDEVC